MERISKTVLHLIIINAVLLLITELHLIPNIDLTQLLREYSFWVVAICELYVYARRVYPSLFQYVCSVGFWDSFGKYLGA